MMCARPPYAFVLPLVWAAAMGQSGCKNSDSAHTAAPASQAGAPSAAAPGASGAEAGAEANTEAKTEAPPSAPPAGPVGTITGKVVLTGTPPKMPDLRRGSDSFCAKTEMKAETVMVGEGGGLQNVLVRIAPGAVPSFAPTEPVVIRQTDCMYRPRVQGAARGQKLQVINTDGTMHNVNARKLEFGERRDTDTVFNRSQPAGSPPLESSIGDQEILKLKCDSHGWMVGYVVVGDTAYHSTSNEGGRFTIEGAPVGSYQLQAWHEYYGVKSQPVTVEEGEATSVEFVFDADKDRPASAGGAQ